MTHGDLTDLELTQSIREMLSEEEYDVSHIHVDIEDGVVYLSGEVGTEDEREEIDNLVSEMIGVEEVSNELTIDKGDDDIDLEDDGDEDDETLDVLEDDEETGTTDPTEAAEEGIPYIPPDKPVYR